MKNGLGHRPIPFIAYREDAQKCLPWCWQFWLNIDACNIYQLLMSITVGYICWYSKKYQSHQKKNKCVVQAAQRDWNDMNVLLQSAIVFTLGTFDGLSLLVFAIGKRLKVCEQYLFITKAVLWMVSVLWAHIPHIWALSVSQKSVIIIIKSNSRSLNHTVNV